MTNSRGKAILLAVGVVAAISITYLAVQDRVGPDEGVQGAIGTAEPHQTEKTRYYEEVNTREDDLSTDKVQTLGKIAAAFESAPTEAEKMLEEEGWSKQDYDRMIEAIRGNDELNQSFQAAKKLASQN